jgi:hypothetical protein
MTESDFEYFQRRTSEEHELASGASLPSAREAHLALARRYGDLAEAMAATASRSVFNDVRASATGMCPHVATVTAPARADAPAFFAGSNRATIVSLLRKVLDPQDVN